MKLTSMICHGGLILLTVFFCAGCASASSGKDAPSSRIQTPVQAKRAGRELLKAFVENKPEVFLDLLPEVVRTEFGMNGFNKTRKSMVEQLGDPLAYAFVMNLEHPAFTVSIWRILFQRKSSDGKKVIRQEGLFRAVSGTVDGKERLLSFNFF